MWHVTCDMWQVTTLVYKIALKVKLSEAKHVQIIIIIIIIKICNAHISHIHPAGCSRRESRNTGASPFSFTISVLGSFTCITQHTGPTALRPIRRAKQLWLSVLLKDTSAATGLAGIRTHILATPELESNALDRSATTLADTTKYDLSTNKLFILVLLTLLLIDHSISVKWFWMIKVLHQHV